MEAVIRAGAKRVVIAMQDPNPLVAGQGIKKLKEAGVDVTVGVMEEEAKKLNEVFIKYITTKKPFVIGKIAQSLDGKVALSIGESKWITNEPARVKVHELRSWCDAVMVGIISQLTKLPTGAIVKISCQRVLEDFKIGESVAVNGVCLIARDIQKDAFIADVMPETLKSTNLGIWKRL